MAINLDELYKQRQEATGVENGRITFEFTATQGEDKGKKKTYSFKDPQFLSDDEIAEVDALSDYGPDVAAWYMGDTQYDQFLTDGGSASLWALVINDLAERATETDSTGRPTRLNRSSRRARRR